MGREASSPAVAWTSEGVKHALWLVTAVVLFVLVVQGATVQKLGLGPLSFEFGSKASSGGGHSATTAAGVDNGEGNGSEGQRVDVVASASANPPELSGDRSRVGPWSQTRRGLTVTVSKVEEQDSHLRLHVSVKNDLEESVSVSPLSITVVDDAGNAYKADPHTDAWPDDFPPGSPVNGVIELSPRRKGGQSITLSFTNVFSRDFAAPDSISVRGILLP